MLIGRVNNRKDIWETIRIKQPEIFNLKNYEKIYMYKYIYFFINQFFQYTFNNYIEANKIRFKILWSILGLKRYTENNIYRRINWSIQEGEGKKLIPRWECPTPSPSPASHMESIKCWLLYRLLFGGWPWCDPRVAKHIMLTLWQRTMH